MSNFLARLAYPVLEEVMIIVLISFIEKDATPSFIVIASSGYYEVDLYIWTKTF